MAEAEVRIVLEQRFGAVKALSRRLFSMSWKIACRPASGPPSEIAVLGGECLAPRQHGANQGGAEQSPRGCMDRHETSCFNHQRVPAECATGHRA